MIRFEFYDFKTAQIKSLDLAQTTKGIIYICGYPGNFWLTDQYHEKWVGRTWPGGRMEARPNRFDFWLPFGDKQNG